MKITDLIPSFLAFKSKTDTALEAANKSIADLTAKLESLEAEKQIRAEESSDSDSESSELDSLISDLQTVLDKYSGDDDSDSSDDSSNDSSDDSDDANDETTAKGKAEKLKALTKKAAQVVADSKKLKDSVASKVIQELAAIGIPTPIATKPDNKPTGLKGRARVAAAFNEQFNNNK